MAHWNREGNKITIEMKPKGIGCLYYGFAGLGYIIIIGAALYIAAIWEDISLWKAMIPGFVMLFGIVFAFSGSAYRKMNFQSTVVLDADQELLTFYKEEKNKFYFGLGRISYARLVKVMKSSGSGNGSRRYPTYQLFLVQEDGAHFWLDTFISEKLMHESIQIFYDCLGMEIKDETGLEYNKVKRKQYGKMTMHQNESYISSFLDIKDEVDAKKISIKEKSSLSLSLFKFVVFVIFFSAPLIIFLGQDSGPHIMFTIFAGLFSLIWYGILSLIFILQLKRFQIVVKYDELALDMKFSFPGLNKLLGKLVVIPRHQIKYVRLHRLDEGNYWLSISVSSQAPIPEPSFLFNLGFINKEAVKDLFPQEKVFGLWEVQGYMKSSYSIDYDGLLYLENLLQQHLKIEEKPISS